MLDEVSVLTMLESALHRSLVQVGHITRLLVQADVTALRVINAPGVDHTSHVDLSDSRLVSGHQLFEWPMDKSSIFHWMSTKKPIAGVFQLGAILDRDHAASIASENQGFGPLEGKMDLRTGLVMGMGLTGDAWVLMIYLKCINNSNSFDDGQMHLLERLMPAMGRVIDQAYRAQLGTQEKQQLALASKPRTSAAVLLAKLSRTERQILSYLRCDVTEREIATAINRSPHTVHVHVKNIYRKLDVTSRKRLHDLF